MEIEVAKAVLRDAGYQVYNLWHVNDVMDRYECDEEEAMDVLEEALTNEATMEQIHFAIREIAEFEGLNEKRR